MRKIAIIAIVALAPFLAACQVTIPNLFGGPALVLTGNLAADMPGIEAFSASVKAGVSAEAAKIRAWFNKVCPYVSSAQMQLADPGTQQVIVNNANAIGITQTALEKQIGNVNTGLSVGASYCAAGTAPNLKAAFTATVDAIRITQSLIKTGNVP